MTRCGNNSLRQGHSTGHQASALKRGQLAKDPVWQLLTSFDKSNHIDLIADSTNRNRRQLALQRMGAHVNNAILSAWTLGEHAESQTGNELNKFGGLCGKQWCRTMSILNYVHLCRDNQTTSKFTDRIGDQCISPKDTEYVTSITCV